MTSRTWLAIAAAVVALAGSSEARAQLSFSDFPDLVDNDYTIDIYQGAALGSVELVGMGGVAVATAQGSAGLFANPAAPAVRPSTALGNWDWDFHIDWLNPALTEGFDDFDNNGIELEQEAKAAPIGTGGVSARYKNWGAGFSITSITSETKAPMNDAELITNESLVGRLSVSRTFFDDILTVGVGIRSGAFSINRDADPDDTNPAETVFSITGASIETGAIWRPHWTDLRVGATASLPVSSERPDVETGCDDSTGVNICEGYIVPERAALPYQLSAGAAWRFAGTRWNRQVNKRWRDEKYVLVGGDIIVTGPTKDGFGIEAFTQQVLQPAGRSVSVGVRTGVEYEWVPGWFRIRGGLYYEPSRYRDDMGQDIAGRAHVTLGLDVRVWTFCFWRERYRVRLSVTGDGAKGYINNGVSLGLWH